MKKKFNRIFLILASVLILSAGMIAAAPHTAWGFGDTNDYSGGDGGGDWSGGDSYSSDGGGGFMVELIAGVVTVLFFVIVFFIITAKNKKNGGGSSTVNYSTVQSLPDRTNEIEALIRKTDPDFSAQDFLAFVRDVYMDIQDAWCKRDLEPVRGVLHENLYEQTEKQLAKKIADGIVPHLDNININTAYITAAKKDTEYEYLTVYLVAKMYEYQYEEKTGKVVYGDKTTRWELKYAIKFMRSSGMRTKDSAVTNARSCPHCGAPLPEGATAVCPYCGSAITQGRHSWVMSEFMTINNDTKDEGINWPEA